MALYGAVLLVVVAVAWGGATTQLAEAGVLGGLGLLWILAPARRLPHWSFLLCGIAGVARRPANAHCVSRWEFLGSV